MSGSRDTVRVLQCVPTLLSSAGIRTHSLVVFCFGVREDVRLQVSRLCKFFAAAIKGAHIRAVSSVNTYMCAQIKVQREPLATALKRALQTRENECVNDRKVPAWATDELVLSTAGISGFNNNTDTHMTAVTTASLNVLILTQMKELRQTSNPPGKVSLLCVQVDASSVLNSQRKLCHTLRRRAHEARGYASASSLLSYP